jgi:hypothetical protein
MLRSTHELTGYTLAAADGNIGTAKDFLFDEDKWAIRWLVADTGTWLPKRKVLISPVSLHQPQWRDKCFPVQLTKEQIENAPDIQTHEPVSRTYERKFFNHFAWPYYWSYMGVWGTGMVPSAVFEPGQEDEKTDPNQDVEDNHLRSTEEVRSYHIQAQDDSIGHIDDFILDDESWILRYIVVDTRNWLPGRKVLLSPAWINAIDWKNQSVKVELTCDQIKKSPKYNPSEPINREYEKQLFDYYGRPVYWSVPTGVPPA